MKTTSTLLFAGAAAAYEYGYVTPSSKPAYTTVTPGGSSYGPVTVTSQYQTVPTYISSASSYSDYVYVSTVITDADGKKCTVTKTDEPITVSHYKSTKTHTTTYAAPTGYAPYAKNGTASSYLPKTKVWEELCEKVVEIPYKHLGPHALPGYPGSGLCGKDCYGSEYEHTPEGEEDDDKPEYQPAHVKEYKNGKWSTYTVTYTYGAPTPKATTYEHPGTYTVPEYDLTVYTTKTVPAEGTYTAPAHQVVTYGGQYTDVAEPTHITAAYATCETKGTETKTIIKTTTIYADKPGHYTIAKPTITSYDKPQVCHYPTAKVYPPGVYHHSKETVTITKSHQAYTCSYEHPSTYPTSTYAPSKPTSSKGTYPTATEPSHTYPTADPSADYPEPTEAYGYPSAGYVKRGGLLERRKAEDKKAAPLGKRVILV